MGKRGEVQGIMPIQPRVRYEENAFSIRRWLKGEPLAICEDKGSRRPRPQTAQSREGGGLGGI